MDVRVVVFLFLSECDNLKKMDLQKNKNQQNDLDHYYYSLVQN